MKFLVVLLLSVGGLESVRAVVDIDTNGTLIAKWSDSIPLVAVKGHVIL